MKINNIKDLKDYLKSFASDDGVCVQNGEIKVTENIIPVFEFLNDIDKFKDTDRVYVPCNDVIRINTGNKVYHILMNSSIEIRCTVIDAVRIYRYYNNGRLIGTSTQLSDDEVV